MLKQLLVVYIFLAFLIRPKSFVWGLNCTSESNQQTDECAFECIRLLFDKTFCSVCPKKSVTLKPLPNDTLSSIVQAHDLLFFNETAQSIASSKCLGCSLEIDGGQYERYSASESLKEFVLCSEELENIDSNTKTCTIKEVNESYTNIVTKLKDKKWCIRALQIVDPNTTASHSIGEKSLLNNSSDINGQTADNQNEKVINSTEPTGRSEDITTNASVTEETQSKSSENDTTTNETMNETVIESTTKLSGLAANSTKPKPTKRTKIVEAHHYMGSVYLIAIIVGVLLTILIISALILRSFVNRRNRLHGHSTSTTYVFEHQ
ncbi:uncharacterized protein LOC116340919 [Contarinia nasturtii]|uniref:uncharacterized protein LOC116340919 n=1 Tax=Contarinia nasturtii TaxID=265458 RepID=UPI0012D3E325|nr:uncharacterized protein LOC116340919 [Contarinia nasturtii]XP_031623531.1 uncharacterized protein LOC116340919 [Contarinia nasturtii]